MADEGLEGGGRGRGQRKQAIRENIYFIWAMEAKGCFGWLRCNSMAGDEWRRRKKGTTAKRLSRLTQTVARFSRASKAFSHLAESRRAELHAAFKPRSIFHPPPPFLHLLKHATSCRKESPISHAYFLFAPD